MKKKTVHDRGELEKLREGEALFQTLRERSLVGIYIVQDGLFQLVNPYAASYTGYTPEELVGKKSDYIVHPEDQETVKRDARAMLRGDRTSFHEFRIVTKQGAIRWIMGMITPISFKGRPAILGNSMDITERKLAEELYKTLAEHSLAAVFIVQEGKVRFINTNAIAYAGYAAEELIGQYSDSIVHPEDKEMVKKKGREMLRGEDTTPYEFRMVTKQGEIRWIMQIVSPIQYEGKPAILGNAIDITGRKQAEEALKNSEEEFRSLVENITVGIYRNTTGPRVRFMQANPAIAKMFGYDSVKEFMNVPIAGLYQDQADRKRFVDALTQTGSVRERELLLKKKDGSLFWASVSAKVHYDNKGNINWIDGVIEDITERKLAEEAIRESERRLAGIIDFLPDATFVIDIQGKVIAWNRATEEMTGVKAEAMLGKGDYEYALPFHGTRRPILIDLVLKPDKKIERSYYSILKKQKGLLIGESWVPFLRGKSAFLWAKASPLYNSKGTIVGAIEVIREITERKLAEEALRESERRLADIIDFLPDATVAIDRLGKVIAWNRAIEEMTGVKAEVMLGKDSHEYALPFYGTRRPILIDLVLKPDRKIERSYYSILKKQKDLLIVETWVPSLRGKRAFLWAKASPLYDSKGKIMGAIESVRDITERKQAEEALKKREMELESKTHELEDLNAALRVLLKQREDDRNELEEKMLSNIKVLVLPYVEKLKSNVEARGKTLVEILESNLNDVISPFAHKLSAKYLNLTDKEIQIANLIKEGKTTKEIAGFLNVSESAVNIHRYRIRHKMNLTNKQNLQTYLTSLI